MIAAAEVAQPSLGNALRELNGLDVFTYVPPFRGRAIRMIDGGRPFDQLEIDFEAIERRKALEYEKLDRVVRFALGGGCRQQQILRYFGERDADECGHCDNCARRPSNRRPETTSGEPHEKIVEAVRMVLSGVARTEARFPCGKNLIAQMLCGSQSVKMEKLGLNQLSTYGLLAHLTQPEVVTLIDMLVAVRYLQQEGLEPGRPVVRLTPSGAEVMKGSEPLEVELPLPAELAAKIRGERVDSMSLSAAGGPELAGLPPADPDLVALLREWRQETATRIALPPHYVLSNGTLEEIARRRPRSPETLLTVKGIGEAKLRRYGDAILGIVAEGGRAEAVSAGEEKAVAAPIPKHPNHYWTCRLLAAGFTVDECVEIRGISREQVLDHAREGGTKDEG